MTRFGVLGPIQLYDAGQARAVGAGIRRTLLAVLLSKAGVAVSRDVLLEAAWPSVRPSQATVRWHVHQLRQLLGDSSQLLRTPGGYLLQVQPEEVDASRFERSLARGRELIAAGDAETAAVVLTEALELWRGPAYDGLTDVELLRDEAGRLAEARLAALELRIEAELSLGRHTALVAELTALVAEHPLHEGFRAQLMLGLYRSGRTADALAAYRTGRAVIADELGLDPGERLRELEQAILVADPALSSTGEIRVLPVPAELPPDVLDLAGRTAELDAICAQLTKADGALPAVAIHGPGGVGKSALAMKAAHRVRSAFPDGQLYADLRGATPGVESLAPEDVLRRFLRSLGQTDDQIPASLDEAAARFRSLTSGRRVLVLLDDVVDAAQVRQLTPGGGGSAWLMTSRAPLSSLDGVSHQHLEAMAEQDALSLLDGLAGGGRVAAEPLAAAEVVRLCGRLPLALRIAGARLAGRPDWRVADLATRLADGERRLDELKDGDLSVRASISVGRQSLGGDRAGRMADRIFWTLPALEIPEVDEHLIGALVGATADDVRPGLDRLVLARLVEVRMPVRYGMHDLVRLYASEVGDRELSAEARAAAIRRTGHACLATLRVAAGLIATKPVGPWLTSGPTEALWSAVPLGSLEEAIAWVDAERGNLVAIAGELSEPAVVVGLAAAARQPFASRGWHAEAQRLGRLAVKAAKGLDDAELVGTAGCVLGSALIATRPAEAVQHLLAARDLFAATGDSLREARVCDALAHAVVMCGRPVEAEQYLLRSIELNHAAGESQSEAANLTNLGIVLLHQGRHEESRAKHEAALVLRRGKGDTRGIGLSLANLGQLDLATDQPLSAVGRLAEAIEFLADWPNRLGLGRLLWDLSTAYQQVGRVDRALEQRERSLRVLVDQGLLTPEQLKTLLGKADPAMPEAYRRFA